MNSIQRDDSQDLVIKIQGEPLKAAGSWRWPPGTQFLGALKTCETFNCVRDAHLQHRGNATFNYPHFLIGGWSKSATTSLYQ